ncbi:MAG: nucleotidyltransferase family protein [Proteobacteria bacterium]|nr:nucleotidyltransferase family protein [Pseudomonadota bacterium]
MAIVLASGVSKRFGPGNKLIMSLSGKSIIEKTVERLEQSNIDEITTVIGYQGQLVRRALKNHNTTFIENPDYSKGMGTSIHAGILSLERDVEAALIVLGDMPFVDPETVNLLLRAHENKNEKLIFVPTYNGKRGNPVLWDKALFPELLSLKPGHGGNKIMKECPKFVQEINIYDDGILVDIDLHKDLKLFEGK